MNIDKTTDELNRRLKQAGPRDLPEYFSENAGELAEGEKPFAAYMRQKIREKGLRQQDVFLAADIPERYGYKLIAEDRKTLRRDIILRLCLGAGFTLEEIQRALRLHNMSELYARVPRDAALILAINSGIRKPEEVDQFLVSNCFLPLDTCGKEDT